MVREARAGPLDAQRIRARCAAMRHRGPDDEGIFVAGGAGLGMRRPAIIDLVSGQQPIFTEDGAQAIVFNGEIYNYRSLRAELLGRGHCLRSQGDTETLLHLYEEQGPRAVERLRGRFASAIWYARPPRPFLATDRS